VSEGGAKFFWRCANRTRPRLRSTRRADLLLSRDERGTIETLSKTRLFSGTRLNDDSGSVRDARRSEGVFTIVGENRNPRREAT
jgi:hypothetical protein